MTSSPAKTYLQGIDYQGETLRLIENLVSKKLSDHDKVAAELVSILGLSKTVEPLIAKMRAQCMLNYPPLLEAFDDFAQTFIADRWDPRPLPDWSATTSLVTQHEFDPKWQQPSYPSCEKSAGWDVNHHYAKFIIRVAAAAQDTGKSTSMVFLVRDASHVNRCWVLYHTLLYLHLERMRENERYAPLATRLKLLAS